MIQLGAKGCCVRCIIGCNPEERELLQSLTFDVEYEIMPPAEDHITATVDYTRVIQQIAFLLEVRQYYLIEYAVIDILETLFASIKELYEMTLVLHKPAALPEVSETYVKVKKTRGV